MDLLHEIGRDVRFAARVLRREPAFVAGVVATFALAIGANGAMFGLVRRLMLDPPPGIHDAERVVRVGLAFTDEDGQSYRMSTMSYPAFQAIAALDGTFSHVAAIRSDTVTIGRGAELAEAAAIKASGDYFATLGVEPALGRFFGTEDDQLPGGADVVVLGHAWWRQRFGGDPSVLGREVIVDETPLTVIGVAPRGFNGTDLAATDLFVPLATGLRGQGAGWWTNPGMRVVAVVARLRERVDPAAASQLVAAAVRSPTGSPWESPTAAPLESLLPGRSARESPQARIALWLSGVSIVVLLIATANVATLLLLRSARRRRDDAVRLAFGARRSRLVRQSIIESVLLAMIGAAGGLLLARWLDSIVRATLLPNLAATDRLVDPVMLAVSLLTALIAGVLAGALPVATFEQRNLVVDLQAGGGHGATGRFRARYALVGFQVALCTLLLIGAGLFVRSLRRVESQDLGFSTRRLLYVDLDFHGRLNGAERDLAHEDAARRLASLADVSAVTVVQGMPFASHHIPPISIPGLDGPPNAGGQIPIMYGATPAYLQMMGVTLREGRPITDQDVAGSPLVVLVNETMARGIWPGESALGKCVRAGHGSRPFEGNPMETAASLPCRQVVGVVRDSRARSLRPVGREATLMQYYVPFGQLPRPPFPNVSDVHAILVQTRIDPDRVASAVQRAIQTTSAAPVHARARPYQELIDPQLRSWRLGATMFTAFGALALGIAAVGLYAVVAYVVAQRSREIGVRLALGGTAGSVARLVVWDAVRMAAVGSIAGVLAALAAGPMVQAMLFETSAREASVVMGAVGVLLAVAVVGAAGPAWRAARVSPLVVLKGS